MPDIFDFITTRDEVQEPLRDTGNLPDLKPVPQINLIPTIPANYRLDKTVGTNPDALLDNLAQRISSLPDNRPAYEYTAQQERRYSNPNLQYSPYPTLGDTEDVYGRKQGGGEQLWNSVVKFGANTVGTFGSAFLTIPRQLDAVRSGNFNEFFNDDGMFEGVQNWLTGLEDKFPNYYTQWERDHPYQSALPFSGGAMNFWGDKMLKNAGFTIGGLAAELVADAAIEIASGGTATPAAFISVANHLNQAKNRMFTAMRGLNKAAIAGKVDDVVGAAKAGSLYTGIQASQVPIKTGLRYATTTYFGAQGESFIEGYHTYLDTKKQLLEEAINRGETDTQTLSEIEKRAQDAGKLTTAFNLPVLMASNLIQFPNLLYGKGAFAKNNPFIKTVFGKEGLEAVNNYSFKKDLKRWALESFKDSSTEGLEEASQYFISNSLHDYYVDRLNPKTKGQLLDFVLDNAPKVLNDPHLYEEAFLGALSGFMMGAPASIPNLVRGKSRYDSLTQNLNNVYSRFNQSNKDFTNNIELNGLTNPDETQIAAHKAIYSTVHDSLKFGTYESFLDSLEDLKTIDLDSYNQTFQTEFKDDSEKLAHIQSLIGEAVSVKKDIENVNKFYPTNPYTNSYLGRKVKSAFSDKTETEINNIQENLFQEFKEVVGYNQSLQRITKGKILATEQNLKNLGAKNEAIQYLANLKNSPKGLFQYSRWKKTQIEDLRNNKTYYERLVKEGTDDSLKPRDELKNVTKRLDEVEKFYENLDKLYQKLKANPKDEDIQNEILAEVLYEETNEDQREKFKEERIRQAKEFEKQNQTQAKLKEEEEDLNKPDSKTAEKIIDLNEEVDDNKEQVQEPIPEPVLRKNSWMNKYEEGKVINHNGQSFIIQSKTEDGMIVKGQDGIDYLVTQENGKLKFTSSIGEMGVSNVPLPEVQQLPIESKENSTKISEVVGKTVYFKGKPYVVVQEGIRYVLDSPQSIVELDANSETTLSELGLSLPERKEEIVSKYNVEIIDEENVTVNGISYKINTDKLSNVGSLSPINKPEQKIRNEKILIAVEVERNKNEFNQLVSDSQQDTQEEKYVEIKRENPELIIVEGIYNKNLSDVVTSGLNKLYGGEELTEQEKLSVDLWVTDAIAALTKVYVRSPNSEIYKNALDNLEIINILLYTNNHKIYEDERNKQNVKSPGINVPSQKRRVQKANTPNKPESSKTSKPEQSIIEPLEQPSQMIEVSEPLVPQLTLGQEEFTWEQIFNQPDSVWVQVSSGVDSNFVYSKEGDTIRKRDFENNVIGNRRYTFTQGSNQPNYIKGNFVQLIRGDEIIISKTPQEVVETELDTQIKSFLGNEYSTDYAKVLETNIALGKIKLIC